MHQNHHLDITVPLHNPYMLVPPESSMGGFYLPNQPQASMPNLGTPFPSMEDPVKNEADDELVGNIEPASPTIYTVLDPNNRYLQPATAANVKEYNTMRTIHPKESYALITLEAIESPIRGAAVQKQFVMISTPTVPYKVGEVVERMFGSILGGPWKLTEVKLRKNGNVYVQWEDKGNGQLAIICMASTAFNDPMGGQVKGLARSISMAILKRR
jgi:hypothetical protein